MIVHKGLKYRIYPNATQQQKLDVQFGHARYIYNWGLAQSQDGYPGYTRLTKQLTILKASEDTAWLKAGHSQVLQQALKNLDRAFQHFFDRRAGYPQFKSKRARQSIRYPQPKPNWIAPDGRQIYLPKVGHVRVVMHRPLAGEMKNVTVSRTKSGKYFVSIQVEVEIGRPVFEGGAVGIDLGLRDFVTLSSGEKLAPPQYYRKAQQKRGRLARQVSRKKPGCRNWEKARLRLAGLDKRIANQRSDYHHRLSRRLVAENRLIALEDLNVRGMMANHHLAKSISDAGWSTFKDMLAYRGSWYGCQVEKVDRWFPSSKICAACGSVRETLPLRVRTWVCSDCGVVHDRDVNAARNLLRQSTVGVTGSNAWGQPVRPEFAAAAGQAG